MTSLFNSVVDALRSPATRLKMLTFALVGVGNTAVDFSVFTLGYKVFELPLVASNILAWLVAVSGSYVLNTYTTFRLESGKILRRRDYFYFVASGVVGMVATTTALVVFALFLHVMVAKLLSILVGFAVNFTMSNTVVFRARSPKA